MKNEYSIRKTKRGVGSVLIGLGLLVSPVALAQSQTPSVLVADEVSSSEKEAIVSYLKEQPADDQSKNIGETAPSSPVDSYKFPGEDQYTSAMMTKYGTKVKLPDQEYAIFDHKTQQERKATIKDIANVDFYEIKDEAHRGSFYAGQNITVVYTDDQTEEVVPVSAVFYDTIYKNHFALGLPIEEADPRIQLEVNSIFDAAFYNFGKDTGYWNLTIPYFEELPYDTILKIDESLKTGEYQVVQKGQHGHKKADFEVTLNIGSDLHNFEDDTDTGFITSQNYRNYNADFLVNTAHQIAKTASFQELPAPLVTDWGSLVAKTYALIESQDRHINVGIDFTNYVAVSGEVLSPKEFGLQNQKDIPNYKLLETRLDNNGDKTYVYEKLPTTPVSPAVPVVPAPPVTPAVPVVPAPPVTPAVPVVPAPPVTPAVPVVPTPPVSSVTPAVPTPPVSPVTPAVPTPPANPVASSTSISTNESPSSSEATEISLGHSKAKTEGQFSSSVIPAKTLPKTGTNRDHISLFGGLGLLMTSLSLMLSQKTKTDRDND